MGRISDIVCDIDINALKSEEVSGFSCCIAVCDKPLVLCRDKSILVGIALGYVRMSLVERIVRTLRKNDTYKETFTLLCTARCIVKGRSVDLGSHALLEIISTDLIRVVCIILFDILSLSEKNRL